MHTAKREKCQILWMGPFHGMRPPRLKKNLVHFWGKVQELWNGPPRTDIWWKIFKFYFGMYFQSCGMDSPELTSGGKFLNSAFACTVQ